MKKPLLSVIIATKDREPYCIAAIDSILSYQDDRIHIAIADNSGTTQVKDYVAGLNSPYISYEYDPGPVSSIDNFNKANGLVKGEYSIMIGDDDTILPNCVEIAAWMKSNQVESVSSARLIDYIWPSAEVNIDGWLTIPGFTGSYKVLNNEESLRRLLHNGLLGYLNYGMPKIYHGIVKSSCMEEIKKRTGNYYGGLSPDIYAAVSLSIVIKQNYVIDIPFSIAGVCKTSTSYHGPKGPQVGTFEDIPHFRHREFYKWNEIVPKFYSGLTIWAESGLRALNEMGRNDLAALFNKYKFYAGALREMKPYIEDIVRKALEETRGFIGDSSSTFNAALKKDDFSFFCQRVKNKLIRTIAAKKKERAPERFEHLPTIEDAVNVINQKVDYSGLEKIKI